MAYVQTDSVYYGPNARSIDISANSVPYDPNNFDHAYVSLIYDAQDYTLVINTVTGMKGRTTFTNPIQILPTDMRGTYHVRVTWADASNRTLLVANSSPIYLTN
ncbi:hypothetical protein H1230_16745 [Paenibacillus sp. 19GGS1-52]|uniref:hypothetical protein n=1 Tax=Paenibacillus sp. 19GGS1-52 TaxID=2758563 RepID=UPI001EFBF0DE|nr:hypothetical protein [Paenibacillus sp. 19GGS1-52]ULO04799.1 hypothetical protein H1230_16745 [Paenibacillus sp. 19GGS1-52]